MSRRADPAPPANPWHRYRQRYREYQAERTRERIARLLGRLVAELERRDRGSVAA